MHSTPWACLVKRKSLSDRGSKGGQELGAGWDFILCDCRRGVSVPGRHVRCRERMLWSCPCWGWAASTSRIPGIAYRGKASDSTYGLRSVCMSWTPCAGASRTGLAPAPDAAAAGGRLNGPGDRRGNVPPRRAAARKEQKDYFYPSDYVLRMYVRACAFPSNTSR